MATKLTGIDINGKRAANWKPADLSSIKSVKVSPNCSQQELFDAIKQIVGESVKLIRTDNTDDKYRNIVDLIMLRIRGALAKAIDQIEKKANNLDPDKLVNDIVENVTSFIDEKINVDDNFLTINKNNIQDLVQVIVEAIKDSTLSNKDDTQTENVAHVEKNIVETKSNKEYSDEKDNVYEEKDSNDYKNKNLNINQNSDVATSLQENKQQALSTNDIAKIQITLDDNFKKLSSLMQASSDIQQSVAYNIDKTSDATTKIISEQTKVIVQTADVVNVATKKITSKTTPNQPKKIDVTQPLVPNALKPAKQESGKKTKQKIFSSSQFKDLTKLIARYCNKTSLFITNSIENIGKQIKTLDEKLDVIQKQLNKSKIPWLLIITLLSSMLIPLFFKKLKEGISNFIKEFDINSLIDNIIKKIDFEKHISTVVENLKNIIIDKCLNIISNPMDHVVEEFKKAYDAILSFADDIKQWVNGKSDEIEKTQKETEKNLKDDATKTIIAEHQRLDENLKKNTKSIEDNCNKETQKVVKDVQETQKTISGQVTQIQNESSAAVTETVKNINKSSKDIEDNALPNIQTEIIKTANSAIEKHGNELNDKIETAEKNMTDELKLLDKEVKENGAPTSVKKETLDKMQEYAEGAKIDTAIDEKPTIPTTMKENVVEDEGKLVKLYAKTEDIDRAAKENGEVQRMQQNVGLGINDANSSPNVLNAQTMQNNISGKLIIHNADAAKIDPNKMYEDMDNVVVTLAKHATSIDEGFKESSELLKNLTKSVDSYFTILDDYTKTIKDRPMQTNNNTVVFSNNAGANSQNSANMDSF